MLHARKVGRVIARPFTGTCGDFKRTSNRQDYAIAPPAPTLLDWVAGAGRATHAMGKIGDIFSMRGIGTAARRASRMLTFSNIWCGLGREAEAGSLTFANFVEFDTPLWPPPRRVGLCPRAGVVRCRPAPVLRDSCGRGIWRSSPPTMAMIRPGAGRNTRGNGCRWWAGVSGVREVGLRGFVDVGASVAAHLGVAAQGPGRSFL